MSHSLHRPAVEVSPVLDQLDDVEHRPARRRSNEGEKCLHAETVPVIEDRKPHTHCFPVASLRAANAISYCRVAWPTAAHTTISKTWSSLNPDAFAAAMSSSVTPYACFATLST